MVLAAEGYPESPAKGDKIKIDPSERTDGYLLHAGTALAAGDLVTAGGRVLSAVGSGPDLAVGTPLPAAAARPRRWTGIAARASFPRRRAHRALRHR